MVFDEYYKEHIESNIEAAYSVKPVFGTYFESFKYIQLYCLLIYFFDIKQLFNPISGITTNQAEGLNRLYKDLQENKELPLDVSILGFY